MMMMMKEKAVPIPCWCSKVKREDGADYSIKEVRSQTTDPETLHVSLRQDFSLNFFFQICFHKKLEKNQLFIDIQILEMR